MEVVYVRVRTCSLALAHVRAVQDQAEKRPLILVAGFIHDVSEFLDEHPGGRHLLVKYIGKDASTAFFGGVYDHSNAAHNVRLSFSLSLPPSSPLRCATLTAAVDVV